MLSAIEVAQYFLALASQEDGELVSNMKLQKLVYYAQGFSLALHDEPLFPEEIRAWTHGPVTPVVYQEYKAYGNRAIDPPEGFDCAAYNADDQALLDDVYAVYGQYSALGLRSLTHNEPPWEETPSGSVISHGAMKAFFATQIVDG